MEQSKDPQELAPEGSHKSFRFKAIDFFDKDNEEERRNWKRTTLEVPVEIKVERQGHPEHYKGSAVLADLSLEGAKLKEIEIPEGLPNADVGILLHFKILEGELKGAHAKAELVRFDEKAQTIGIKLLNGFQMKVD